MLLCPAGSNAGQAGVDPPAIRIVIGEQQRPEPGPGAFRIGPADHHEVFPVQSFHLEPTTPR
jgi:hypothetical protein